MPLFLAFGIIISQRWIVFFSQAAYEREKKTFEKEVR